MFPLSVLLFMSTALHGIAGRPTICDRRIIERYQCNQTETVPLKLFAMWVDFCMQTQDAEWDNQTHLSNAWEKFARLNSTRSTCDFMTPSEYDTASIILIILCIPFGIASYLICPRDVPVEEGDDDEISFDENIQRRNTI
jgi:hypothetical protein